MDKRIVTVGALAKFLGGTRLQIGEIGLLMGLRLKSMGRYYRMLTKDETLAIMRLWYRERGDGTPVHRVSKRLSARWGSRR